MAIQSLLLTQILRTEGPTAPAVLMDRLKVSQPTLFRAVKSQMQELISLGANRNRKIAALREVRKIGSHFPLFRISSEGKISEIAQLFTLHPRSTVLMMKSALTRPNYFSGIPYFLDDARPQGFLGRGFSQKHADLRLPQRISDWSADDILEALVCRGEDLVGNLLLGAESFERYQRLSPAVIKGEHPESHYLKYAQAAVDGEPAGSSAGGEQPKFGAVLQQGVFIKHVLVKFSPMGNTWNARRWRDLLICEFLSLEILRKNNLKTPQARLIETEERLFLETERFDRIGHRGRKGLVSLMAVENECVGHRGAWASSALALQKNDQLSLENLKTIRLLDCFGSLIGNSDRHPGNLSFFWEPGDLQLSLAPVYDMLPMLYAPSTGGEDTGKTFAFPSYDHTLIDAWQEAFPLALEYWEKIQQDSRVSETFRKIAGQNVQLLKNKN